MGGQGALLWISARCMPTKRRAQSITTLVAKSTKGAPAEEHSAKQQGAGVIATIKSKLAGARTMQSRAPLHQGRLSLRRIVFGKRRAHPPSGGAHHLLRLLDAGDA